MNCIFPATVMVVMASSVAAQERMTRMSCQDGYQRAADLIAPNDDNVALQVRAMRVTPDGWCQLDGDIPGWDDVPFQSIEWRMENSARWTRDGIAPLAVQVRIAGFDPEDARSSRPGGAPPLDIEATLRQDPGAGLLILETLLMTNDFGDLLSVSGVFERVYLTSPSMMQVSMGSATFKAGLVSMRLEGTHDNPFGFHGNLEVSGTPKSQSEAAFDGISRLPDGLMDNASRAELMAYAGDLPNPVGTLEVSVASERGLGLMQVGSSLYSGFTAVMDDGEMSNEMEILFDGLSVSADWTPSGQTTD